MKHRDHAVSLRSPLTLRLNSPNITRNVACLYDSRPSPPGNRMQRLIPKPSGAQLSVFTKEPLPKALSKAKIIRSFSLPCWLRRERARGRPGSPAIPGSPPSPCGTR